MNNVEKITDRIAATSLEKRRNREIQRQDRIFNAKVRTIGIDTEALDFQVNEKKQKEANEAESRKAYAEYALLNDKTACLLDQRQRKDERLLREAVDDFRLNFQSHRSRREYDLSNPDEIRTQEGMQMLPGLAGEDPDSQGRQKRQQEQLREWSIQQQHELATERHRKRLEEQRYDQDRVDLDNKALQLQKMEDDRRRAVALATKDFNRSKAAENAEKRRKEAQQEQENNRTDILNHLQGELLTESLEQGVSVLGLPRLRPDHYKGLVNQQLQPTDGRQQQIEEKKRIQAERQQQERQQEALRVASARAAILLERQEARINKQLRRTLDNTNAQLAEARQQQKKLLEKVYTNIPDEQYFSQFNTSSR
ncbi:hypothetical protein DPEC_G00163480 [Dallia pectoralis]|uniref:Uncharacterized protein n=1 Tax=Dallia pectoralis TaxID=75939 RepID=A0ACC2GHA2_DALPE|nr:hypothetical protein DPEC_G00163480 [Dallia pectoralis]